MFCVNYFCKT